MSTYAVAVTGGIASGKSAVTSAFEKRGIAVADADLAARAVVAPGSEGLAEITKTFGPNVLSADGSLDRAAMRALVFADPQARTTLESITHPRIRNLLLQQAQQATSPYVVVAIPLLTEIGGRKAYPWLQRVLVVDVDHQTQWERLMARDSMSEVAALGMIAAQASQDDRLAIADDIVRNEGTLEQLDAAIADLHALYLRLAGAGAN